MDGKTVKAAFKQHHTIFNDIKISETYSHTNYFSDGEFGQTIGLYGMAQVTKLELDILIKHFDFKWENGVVVQLQCYFDPTGLNMELSSKIKQ